MTRWNRIARTRHASGRFLFSLAGASLLLLGGCQRIGTFRPETPPAAVTAAQRGPVLEEGRISASAEARAATLYARANEALGAGDPARAQALAAEVVQLHPRAPVSGAALLLYARANLEVGALEAADEAAGRYASLVPPGDARAAEARLIQADAQARRGDEAGRLARLLLVGPATPEDAARPVVAEVRAAAAALEPEALAGVLEAAPADGVARGAAEAVYAAALAERASAGPSRTLTIGSVLPTGGSPALREFAEAIAEGIEVAAATWLEDAAVTVAARDDAGVPARSAGAVRELVAAGALGAVGFLEDGALGAAAGSRPAGFPIVSPTARSAEGEGVYTLSGADPSAASAMADYAAREGFRRVAIVHASTPDSEEEADAFESTLRTLGVPIAGRFAYPGGTTDFREQVRSAREALRAAEIRALRLGPDDTLRVEMLEPVALFAPVPPEDVELLAPQFTFFGLDTLAIRVLGTSGWTDGQVLETVDTRHTTGVVATAAVGGGTDSPGFARFRQAYERHFQRTLVNPVPALGWDAALLLLEAARDGVDTPERLKAALERIRDLEGATGSWSVVGGRAVRRTHIVRIENGTLIPIP